MKKLATVVAIAALSAGGTQAASYDWGTHVFQPSVETAFGVGGGSVSAGSFLDTYLFSLTAPAAQESNVAVAINLSNFNISGGSYSLFSTLDYGTGTALDDVQVAGNWSFDGTTGSTVHTVSNLDSGNYYFAVAGIGGSEGGQYLLTSSITAPVPEPEIYAMLGIGLGFLGWARRRSKKQPTA